MSYADDLKYQALLLIAASRGDQEAGARAYETAWDSQVDPIHIAQYLAATLGSMGFPEEQLDAELAVAAAAAAATVSEPDSEPLFLSPRGRVRKPKKD